MQAYVELAETGAAVDFNAIEKVILAKRIGRRLSAGCSDDAARAELEDVARRLSSDGQEAVREALSFEVRLYPDLPQDIATTIALDSGDVASPFLMDTASLDDDALIAIAERGGHVAWVAIARREPLSAQVAFALATHGDERAATTLARNECAELTEKICGALLERFPNSPAVLGELAMREDVSAEVRRQISAHLEPRVAPEFSELPQDVTFASVVARMRRLQRRGELTSPKIREMVERGGRTYLEAALVVMARVPRTNVKVLLDDASGRGFTELMRRAGISKSDIDAIAATLN